MYSTELYNQLPYLGDAFTRLRSLPGGPQNLLKYLAPVFKDHPYFGICLVHRHCTLEDGERMLSVGRVSQPEIVEEGKYFPERWLANGDPYEFSSHPTVENDYPLSDLLEAFSSRLTAYSNSFKIEDLSNLLGVYFTSDPDTGEATLPREDIIWVEKTEGRQNIIEPVPREQAISTANSIQAGWNIVCKKREGSEEEWDIVLFNGCTCTPISRSHYSPLMGPEYDESRPGPECHVYKGFLISERLVC